MDIIKRLRGLFSSSYGPDEIERAIDIVEDAADEIEKLRKEIELLHSIVANVRKTVRDGLYKYEMKKNPTGLKNIKWEKE